MNVVKIGFIGALFYLVIWVDFLPAGFIAGVRDSGNEAERIDYVDMVDPYIMSARGRWFFFGTGKRPFGMVNLFPDTSNAGQGGGGFWLTF